VPTQRQLSRYVRKGFLNTYGPDELLTISILTLGRRLDTQWAVGRGLAEAG